MEPIEQNNLVKEPKKINKKIIYLIIGGALLILVIIILYFIFRRPAEEGLLPQVNQPATEEISPPSEATPRLNINIEEEEVISQDEILTEEVPEDYIPTFKVDTDDDGLTDEEEDFYGTNKNNPDSDEDGYLDGEEVRKGYNPLGEGRRIKIFTL